MNQKKGNKDRIKKHFEKEAPAYDDIIPRFAPRYREFLDAMVSAILKDKEGDISVLDLGCGTGNVTLEVKHRFPNARVTCVDVSPNMLGEAGKKLKGFTGIEYRECDVRDFDFPAKYDIVLAQLSLHHISDPEEKKSFYHKVYDSLNKGGSFIISDVILAANEDLQDMYISKWVDFMKTLNSNEEVEECLKNYHAEDTPFRLVDELDWLREAGFGEVDVVCKYYNGAVYLGIKRV